MEREERALQMWSLLALCARNRQTLTYDLVARLTGVPAEDLDRVLEPLHLYCAAQHLPSLTALVIDEETAVPRGGYLSAEEAPIERERVYQQDWLSWTVPTAEEITAAIDGKGPEPAADAPFHHSSGGGRFSED